ncbi:AP-3 complex subunit delta-1-like isoform X1 [Ornithodoros turicata]|uniref:AP-3 complex subunit delta-1-like isoform X1 n=1 Tax=Ornithodoros turicata TaxID=34597 RepID=UPI003138C910
MALRKVKGNLEHIFDKNLKDLVRGIRSNKANEAKYISQCIDEIKEELRQENMAVKANAVAKLAYLQMLGYDISWAAFNIIEVMSSSKFTYKRTGYLAASQSFHEGTEVLMLTTNMIRKDLNSQNMYDSATAMSGLACFVTPDLSRDLANDVMTLLSSTKPYLRKKAVLLMYKIFLRFPDALRPAFPRLKEKLEDPDPGVQSAAVNVICELARKNPKNYLSQAPVFFKLMTSSSNNWMLIKIIKLFGALTPLEPRLGKKLIEPLTNLIHSTSAMSLLYECINTVIAVLISISSGMPNHSASIQLCVQKLRILIEDSDQNLKYLGLLAMCKILKTHPKSVQAHKDLILQCLDDKDESIRLRALDLLYGMVSKKNLMEIVKKLMVHMDRAEGTIYRDELLSKIVDICSQNNYQYITNFEWYVSVLVELTRIEGTKHGLTIASQMLDVAIRVPAVRAFSVSQMAVLLDNTHLLLGNGQKNSICEVLYAAAWICGEFSDLLERPRDSLEALLGGRATSLPPHIQSVYVHNATKIWARMVAKAQEEEEDGERDFQDACDLMAQHLPQFVQSADLEVQERACCALNLMRQVSKLHARGERMPQELRALFAGELNPVAPKAQKKVPIPEGLDLDLWINEPPSESSSEDENSAEIFISADRTAAGQLTARETKYEPTEDELRHRREARRQEQASNPHYLKATKNKGSNGPLQQVVDDIPVAHIDLSVPLHIPGLVSSDKYLNSSRGTFFDSDKDRESKDDKRRRKKKRSHRKKAALPTPSDSEEDVGAAEDGTHLVNRTLGEMPEGAHLSDDDGDSRSADDPHRALDIDLDEPENIPPPRQARSYSPLGVEEGQEVVVKGTQERILEKGSDKKVKKKKKKERRHRSKEREQKHTAEVQENQSRQAGTSNGQPHKNLDDLDFWLTPSADTQAAGDSIPQSAPTHPSTLELHSELNGVDESPQKGKKKKRKGEEEKKRKKKDFLSLLEPESPKDKAQYEEAPGITTPSKEPGTSVPQTPATPSAPPPASNYRLLAENQNIKLVYEVRTLPAVQNEVVVSIIFTNLSSHHLKEMELNILDTLNTKLVRGIEAHAGIQDGIRVPFQLPPGAANEAQFGFKVQSVNMPQRLRGTFTYMAPSVDGGLTHEKLDLKLHLPVSCYLLGTMHKRDTFSELLRGGELSASSSFVLNPLDLEFSHVLSKICFHCHFSVVEKVGLTASLYSRSIQDDHICLLIKHLEPNRLSVEGKCTNSQLLGSVLDEVKALLSSS